MEIVIETCYLGDFGWTLRRALGGRFGWRLALCKSPTE
jgi:hypothetical protein